MSGRLRRCCAHASPPPRRWSVPAAAILFLLTVAGAVASPAGVAAQLQGLVIGISDGDTLTVLVGRDRVRVRLADIDAPERGQPYARRARESLAQLCHARPATVAVSGKDRYGRMLGRVTCGGVMANGEQVRRGYAWVYARYARRDSPLHALQQEARKQGRGLWRGDAPTPPWEWRSRKRESQAKGGA